MKRANRAILRPSVADDFIKTVGRLPPFRIKGYTAETENKILGLGGLGFHPNGVVAIYLILFEGYKKYPLLLHKAALKVLSDAKELGIKKVMSFTDPDYAGADYWHERLGFTPVVVDGQRIYQWISE